MSSTAESDSAKVCLCCGQDIAETEIDSAESRTPRNHSLYAGHREISIKDTAELMKTQQNQSHIKVFRTG